jgi:hypothetical protein
MWKVWTAFPLLWFAVTANAAENRTYLSSDGHEFEESCNVHGFKLISKSGGVVETLYLGANCDAFHKQYRTGKWCWANGGFLVEFGSVKFGFPRQELVCSSNDELGTKCWCPNE